jgi:hypothetical protein
MAKTNAPLLSWGASGKIADTQVYSTWKGRSYVRRYVIPANPNTAGQQLTRNTFRFLNRLWQYMPAGAVGAWDIYADNSRFTARNGFMKQNNGPLREETDLTNIVLSVSAGAGIIAASATPTPSSTSISVAVVPPALPTGWTVERAWAMAVLNVDPQTDDEYFVTAGSDDTDPYTINLTGLTASTEYVVGGWLEYTKPNGSPAYGQSLQSVVSTTA